MIVFYNASSEIIILPICIYLIIQIIIINTRVLIQESMHHSFNKLQRRINQYRIELKLRILWPDFEVYDLVDSGINLDDIGFFTSNPIQVIKMNNEEQELQQPFNQKTFTHMSIHRKAELNDQAHLDSIFYVILSRRGLAVDQFNSRFLRGNYLITIHVAQIDRQISLWGIESIGDEINIIGPKYITKKNCMWVLQFQSKKSLKSILVYSVKHQPRYGKKGLYQSQLPKDSKLQFCMKTRVFGSVMESLMNRQQNLVNDVFYLKPSSNNKNNLSKQDKDKQNESSAQIKNKLQQFAVPYKYLSPKSTHCKQITIRILPNSFHSQLFSIQTNNSMSDIIQKLTQLIKLNERRVHQMIEEKEIQQDLKKLILNINFNTIRTYTWSQIESLLKLAQQCNINELYQYLLIILIFIFYQAHQKNIESWIELFQHTEKSKNVELKINLCNWMEELMNQYCRDMLKDCDEQIYNRLGGYKEIVMRAIKKALSRQQISNAKVSDLLYIAMRVEGKNSIFDLYRSHQNSYNSFTITSSLRNWQINHHLYPKDNENVLYEIETIPQSIQYKTQPISTNNQSYSHNKNQYDFSITFNSQKFSNHHFLSGKYFSINQNLFKYYIFRKQDRIYCFLQQISQSSSKSFIQKFSSYEISISLTVQNQQKVHKLAWNFIFPSLSIGTSFLFSHLQQNVKLQCKISLTRLIMHESILNYLRIRYQELIKMKNKCSDKMQQENRKVFNRRSSLLLEREVFDLNFPNSLEQSCFLHKICEKCEGLSKQTSIYQLSPMDLYSLMLSAPFKNEIHAFLATLKYLMINLNEQRNIQFWMSQIRIQYLDLKQLLKIINQSRLDPKFLQIVNDIIDSKMQTNALLQRKIEKAFIFLKRSQSRIGRCLWGYYQKDFSEEYLLFLENIKTKV